MTVTVHHGDCLEVMRGLPDGSVDAIVTDPPYGLEFMGREWDRFRVDDPGTNRHRGEYAGRHGETERSTGAFGSVVYGGGKRPTTSRCTGCGKRDQFRNGHECTEGAVWATELIREDGAPPSMLAFGEWCRQWATEARRVLKPGGHVLAFGGSRTWHRLACAIEDAGFEIRDSIAWVYGSGFPKSLDVSKAIDKAAGVERTDREVAGYDANDILSPTRHVMNAGTPVTPEAARWQGWGTGLKPAFEPIVVGRKPLAGTVAANVLTYGPGALNIDGCRVAHNEPIRELPPQAEAGKFYRQAGRRESVLELKAEGRWPANLLLGHAEGCEQVGTAPDSVPVMKAGNGSVVGLGSGQSMGAYEAGAEIPRVAFEVAAWECVDGCPVAELDRQSGDLPGGNMPAKRRGIGYGSGAQGTEGEAVQLDGGSASRFFPAFRYESKAPAVERPLTAGSSGHPTVKPLDLMRWLVRLVTPPGGTVLDPFAGSGTTGEACIAEGFAGVLIERNAEYLPLIEARLAHPAFTPAVRARRRPTVTKPAEGGLFDLLEGASDA